VVEPCLAQDAEAWDNLIALLKTVLVRHIKGHLQVC
jgi:hypothetical protein